MNSSSDALPALTAPSTSGEATPGGSATADTPAIGSGPRPVWLLDVDGVINGTGRAGWHLAPRTGQAFADGLAFRMRWAPQLIAEIRSLLPQVDVWWATTWIDAGTEQLEELFMLPSLPHAYPADPRRVARRDAVAGTHTFAKTQAALAVAASGRPLIWTDDEAIPDSGPQRDALDLAGALLIAPDPRRALRPEHLEQIRAFVGLPR